MCFNTSAYIAIIWLSFDKKFTVLSKFQTELRSVKYRNPTKWNVQKYGRWPPLKFRQFLSMAVIFYGYILGKMLYFSIIMTTTGIKWWNSRCIWISVKKNVFDPKFRNFDFCLKLLSTWMQMQNWKRDPNLSTETRDMTSNKELHIPMQMERSKMGYTKSAMSF